MSSVCGLIRGSFGDYLRDTLPAPQRRMLRDHLASCEACRAEAAGADPTLLFARPVRDEVSEPDRQRILTAVRTGVELIETERRIGRRSRRLAGPAAAAAVTALILLIPGSQASRSARRSDTSAAADTPQKLAPAPAPAVTASAGLQPAGWTEKAGSPTSDATIYDWNPGAGREEPRVVWIVDRGLDI
jgi:hypothetical protein